MGTAVYGIRGAIDVASNDREAILSATMRLLQAILDANPQLNLAHIASAFFTLTPDLDAIYPAAAARALGWEQVPLLCAQEIPVPGGLPRCVRVLIHWNTTLSQSQINHVYLGQAAQLRPDLNPNGLPPTPSRHDSG